MLCRSGTCTCFQIKKVAFRHFNADDFGKKRAFAVLFLNYFTIIPLAFTKLCNFAYEKIPFMGQKWIELAL